MSSRTGRAVPAQHRDRGRLHLGELSDGGRHGVLPLSPSAPDLPSAQFVTDGKVQVASLAETLRSIVTAANQRLEEAPASVEVTYPGSWDPSWLFLLWEALVLAGIPDAVTTQAVADPKPLAPAPRVEHEPSEAKTALLPQPRRTHHEAPLARRCSDRRHRRGRGGWRPRRVVVRGPASPPGYAQSRPVIARRPPPKARPRRYLGGRRHRPEGPASDLPTSEALAPHRFVVPRGRSDATQLNLASVSGVVPARRLPPTISGRNSWPVLSADRRTIIYISHVAGSLRTMAVGRQRRPRLDQITTQELRPDHPCFVGSCGPVDHGRRVSGGGPAGPALGDQARWHRGASAQDGAAAHRRPDDLSGRTYGGVLGSRNQRWAQRWVDLHTWRLTDHPDLFD